MAIDAKGKTLGRLASEVSQILTGKQNLFTPHLDCRCNHNQR